MKYIIKTLSLLITLSLLSATGCNIKNVAKESGVRPYSKIVNQWTRSGKIYDDLDTIIILDALYKNWVVEKTYLDENSKKDNISAEEKEALLAKKKTETDESVKFLLAIYTEKKLWNDFDKKDSIWSIRLKDNRGKSIVPKSIKSIKQKDIKVKRFYPFITPWKKLYEIEFPKNASLDINKVHMVISSMIGTVKLDW